VWESQKSWATYRYVGMDIVALSILVDEPAEQFVDAGIEDLKALVILREDLLQRFDFLLQGVKARHLVAGFKGNWSGLPLLFLFFGSYLAIVIIIVVQVEFIFVVRGVFGSRLPPL